MQKGTAGWESWTKIEVAFECLNAVDHWVTVASSNKVYRTSQTNELDTMNNMILAHNMLMKWEKSIEYIFCFQCGLE